VAQLTPELKRPPLGESAGRPRTFSLCNRGGPNGNGAVGDHIARSRQGRHRKRQVECRQLDPRELSAERGGQVRLGGIPQNAVTKSAVGPFTGTGRSGASRWNEAVLPLSRGEQ